jgi:hypothetical protein
MLARPALIDDKRFPLGAGLQQTSLGGSSAGTQNTPPCEPELQLKDLLFYTIP